MRNLRDSVNKLIAEICSEYTGNNPSKQVLQGRMRALANKQYNALRASLPHWEAREALDDLVAAIYAETVVALMGLLSSLKEEE